MQRVIITKRPPAHSTGDDSPPCSCKGRSGRLVGMEIVVREHVGIVAFDAGGRAGIPMNCLRYVTTNGNE